MSFQDPAQPMPAEAPVSHASATPVTAPAPTEEFNAAKAFKEANLIYVPKWSYRDPQNLLLFVNPPELKDTGALVTKIKRAYDQHYPPIFADERKAVFLNQFLGMIPLSIEAKQQVQSEALAAMFKEMQTGKDADVERQDREFHAPFAARTDMILKNPKPSAASTELLKNAVGLYLIIDEALKKDFSEGIAAFADEMMKVRSLSPEVMFGIMQSYTGMAPRDIISTAQTKGLNGVAQLLKVDESFVKEVKLLLEVLPDHHFSHNAITAWQIGRQLPGMQFRGPEEKIDEGAKARVAYKFAEIHAALADKKEMPKEIAKQIDSFASELNLIPKNLAEVLFLNNTEIIVTPDYDLRKYFQDGPLGLHASLPHRTGDVNQLRKIFVATYHGAEERSAIMVHEAHHFELYTRLKPSEIATIDQKATAERERLNQLKPLMDEWAKADNEGNEAGKQAVEAKLDDEKFNVGGKRFSELRGNADMRRVSWAVNYAYNQLQHDSNFYYRSGYSDAPTRFAEVISRYSTLRDVTLRENQTLVQFVAPNITRIYEDIYLPKVAEELADLKVLHAAQGKKKIDDPQLSRWVTATTLQAVENVHGKSVKKQPMPLMTEWEAMPLTKILAQTASFAPSPAASLPAQQQL